VSLRQLDEVRLVLRLALDIAALGMLLRLKSWECHLT
jgi:hypothetical protein